jgi:hypothetical protein
MNNVPKSKKNQREHSMEQKMLNKRTQRRTQRKASAATEKQGSSEATKK